MKNLVGFAAICFSFSLQGAVISALQASTTQIPAGSSTVSVSVNSGVGYPTDKTAVFFTARSSGSNMDDVKVYTTRTESGGNVTSFSFTRSSTSGTIAVDIQYWMVYWSSGATVRYGTFSLAGTVDVATATPDFTKATSFLVYSYTYSGTSVGNHSQVRGIILNDDSLEFRRSATTGVITGTYQVIDYAKSNVQHGTLTIAAAATTPASQPTISAVSLNKSFLLTSCSFDHGSIGSISDKTIEAYISSTTTLNFSRVGTAGSVYCAYQVVSFTDGTTTQAGVVTMADADLTEPATITDNGTANTIVIPTLYSYHKNAKSSGNITGSVLTTLALTDGATVTAARGNATDVTTVRFSVIKFSDTATRRIIHAN